MKKLDKILLEKNATIKEAMEVIDKGAIRIAIIHENRKFFGTLTDGDIRRAILDGKKLEDTILDIINKTPTIGYIDDSPEQIKQKALSKSLYQIPIVDYKGIICDVIDIKNIINNKVHKNKVVLMAGGLGTRLRPLTQRTPKPLLKVGGKPILETIIENFAKYGFRDFILSVNYKAEMFEEYFKDGSKWGVNIEYIHENKRLGTAGALSLMRDKLDSDFFVMNGDLMTTIDFETLLNYHKNKHSLATMCVREYEYQIPFGVVKSKSEKILKIEEKPTYFYHVNAGIYMLSPEVLSNIPNDTFFDMPTLFNNLIETNRIYSYAVEDYWLDIGKMEEYEKAQIEYAEVFKKEEDYA